MKYMKIAITIFVSIWLILPFPMPGTTGSYNKLSNLYWCASEIACIHEIGHKLDDEAGWISHSQEFQQQIYLLSDDWNSTLLVDKRMEEMYAGIFESANGKQENMPEIFWKFYDWKRAEELMEQIARKYGED